MKLAADPAGRLIRKAREMQRLAESALRHLRRAEALLAEARAEILGKSPAP